MTISKENIEYSVKKRQRTPNSASAIFSTMNQVTTLFNIIISIAGLFCLFAMSQRFPAVTLTLLNPCVSSSCLAPFDFFNTYYIQRYTFH